MKSKVLEVNETINFIRSRVKDPALITRQTFTIRCSCRKRIEFEGSYLDDPGVYGWLEEHVKHGCFLKVGGDDRSIEIPRLQEKIEAEESRPNETKKSEDEEGKGSEGKIETKQTFDWIDDTGKKGNAPSPTSSSNELQIETLHDLLTKKIRPREEIVDSLIGRKDFIILSGPQKKFKSLASLNLAIRAAQGKPWLGFEILLPLRVGIVQQEIPEESFQDRLRKMMRGIEDKDFLKNISHLTCRGLKLDCKEGVEKLRQFLDKAKVDLLIADPLYLFHNGKENDPKDMSKVCQVFQDANQDYSCSTVLIHHHGKPSQVEREGGDLHRGTSLLRDATDGNWTFTRVPQNKYDLTESTSRYVLLSFEQRHNLSPEPILLKLNFETLWLELADVMQRQQVKVQEVVECLREHGGEMPNEELLLALMGKLQTGDRACRQGISMAKGEGKILPGKGEGRGHRRTWKLNELLCQIKPKV